MAAPQEGYPPQGYPTDQYGQSQPDYGAAGSPPPPAGALQPDGGKKKKRGYAQQAYDFGGNAALPLTQGQPPAIGGDFQQVGAQPAYGGYPPQGEQQPAYGAPYGAQPVAPIGGAPAPYGNTPQYGGGVEGYQPPDAGYPGPGAPAPAGVAGITQGMGQMGMGGVAPAAPNQTGGRPAVLNQLYPTDLLNQPFNVAELDLPPPPIILPANVSYPMCLTIIFC